MTQLDTALWRFFLLGFTHEGCDPELQITSRVQCREGAGREEEEGGDQTSVTAVLIWPH